MSLRLIKMSWLVAVAIFITASPSPAAKPIVLKGGDTFCVLPTYNFDLRETEFPDLNLPDNALLLLKGKGGVCEPDTISVEQNGVVYEVEGYQSHYAWASFHAVFFNPLFDKFKPYKLRDSRGAGCEVSIGVEELGQLTIGAEKRGNKPYVDPVNTDIIKATDPLELPKLLSHGRYTEYSHLALDYFHEGGVPLLRREARSALASNKPILAACLGSLALKWAPTVEPYEVRRITDFQDWILIARAFRKMKRPLAAMIAYDQALKIRKEKSVLKEKKDAEREYRALTGASPESLPELSEAELDSGNHGTVPIPDSEVNLVEGGVKANGIYLGDHRDRVIAQCGKPSETLSEMLFYFDHPKCPGTIFISPAGRVYSIRTARGKTARKIGIGSSIAMVVKVMGKPDKTEALKDKNGKVVGKKWIYLKQKIAFVDFDGDKRIESIDVFDYSLLP